MKRLFYFIIVLTIGFFIYNFMEDFSKDAELSSNYKLLQEGKKHNVLADSLILNEISSILKKAYHKVNYKILHSISSSLVLQERARFEEVKKYDIQTSSGLKLTFANVLAEKNSVDTISFLPEKDFNRKGYFDLEVVTESQDFLVCNLGGEVLAGELIVSKRLEGEKFYNKFRYYFNFSIRKFKRLKNIPFKVFYEKRSPGLSLFIIDYYLTCYNYREKKHKNLLIIDFPGLFSEKGNSGELLDFPFNSIKNTKYTACSQACNFKSLFTGKSIFEFSSCYKVKKENNYLEMLNRCYKTFKLDEFLFKNKYKVNYFVPFEKKDEYPLFNKNYIVKNHSNYNISQLKECFKQSLNNVNSNNFFYVKLKFNKSFKNDRKIVLASIKQFVDFLEEQNILNYFSIYIVNTTPLLKENNLVNNMSRLSRLQYPIYFTDKKTYKYSSIRIDKILNLILKDLAFPIPDYLKMRSKKDYNLIKCNNNIVVEKDSLWLALDKGKNKFTSKVIDKDVVDFALKVSKEDYKTIMVKDFFKVIHIKNKSSLNKKVKINIESSMNFKFVDNIQNIEKGFRRKYRRHIDVNLSPNEEYKRVIYYRENMQSFSFHFSDYFSVYYGGKCLNVGEVNKFYEHDSNKGICLEERECSSSDDESGEVSVVIKNYPAHLIN